jgi:hypothetical protein
MDLFGAVFSEAPELRGGVTAQQRPRADRELGTEEVALSREGGMAHRVHAAVEAVEPADSHPIFDAALVHAE